MGFFEFRRLLFDFSFLFLSVFSILLFLLELLLYLILLDSDFKYLFDCFSAFLFFNLLLLLFIFNLTFFIFISRKKGVKGLSNFFFVYKFNLLYFLIGVYKSNDFCPWILSYKESFEISLVFDLDIVNLSHVYDILCLRRFNIFKILILFSSFRNTFSIVLFKSSSFWIFIC